jgi:D-alanyl-D-alanine carboxypeptidase
LVIAGALLVFAGLILSSAPAEARYASIVIDAGSGRVLYARNADTRNYPASLTKIMTLYMVFEALEDGRLTLSQRIKVSKRAAGMSPSKLGLRPGQSIKVEDAILALVTKSANDVAVVIAEALGGTERTFGKMMTKRAKAIGLTRTTFRNASGLPNRGQLSTARDMATLGQSLLRRFPSYYRYFSTKHFTYKGRTYGNHNKLLKTYKGTDGIKTGYIRASGYNLVASVKRGGRRLIAVVFGGKTGRSRDRHMAKLLDKGFKRVVLAGIRKDIRPPSRKPLQLAQAAAPRIARPVERAQAIQSAQAIMTAPPTKTAQSVQTKSPMPLPAPRPDLLPVVTAATSSPGPKIIDVPPTRAAGRWGVQVGAFYRYPPAEKAAQRASKQVPDLLGDSKIKITHVRGRKGRIYRARLVGLQEAAARSACKRLKSADTDCLVVQTDKGVKVAQRN